MPVVDGAGAWAWIRDGVACNGSPALFLDRDGVIVEEADFLDRPEDVRLIDGAAETISAFNDHGIPVVVVTNQSGVGRGFFPWSVFEDVNEEITRQLTAGGACVDAVYACAYHRDGVEGFDLADHAWRKPNPGMFLAAAAELSLNLQVSWVVGDRARDLAAGKSAGLAGGIHVGTGHANAEEATAAARLVDPGFQVREADSITGALDLVKEIVSYRC